MKILIPGLIFLFLTMIEDEDELLQVRSWHKNLSCKIHRIILDYVIHYRSGVTAQIIYGTVTIRKHALE